MLEHVAQMGPMLIVAALMVAWLTDAFSWSGGRGLIPDMAFGLIGSMSDNAKATAAIVRHVFMWITGRRRAR